MNKKMPQTNQIPTPIRHHLLKQRKRTRTRKLTAQADLDALQLEMDELLSQIAAVQEIEPLKEEEETIEIPVHNRRRKIHGRNSLPTKLITEVTIHKVPSASLWLPLLQRWCNFQSL